MKSDAYPALLKALQKLEKGIAAAGLKAARGPRKAWAQALHAQAETGGGFDDFARVLAGRSAVQFLLRTLYVRVLEDLNLLDPPRIRGQRGYAAFRDVAPALGVRDYLAWTFRDLAVDFPDLFAPRDDELPLPDAAHCQAVWDLWHAEDGAGNLLYDWSGGDFDSRFLGDLYQDLDPDVKKRFALLQTPDFVEAYILDHTLTPALEVFDPADLHAAGDAFRVIDPTCGSGHFLIGAFHRLADGWQARGLDAWAAAERALDSVYGCDLNPHAVHIARFRLLLEARARTGERDLARLAALPVHLRVLDSLVPWEGPHGQQEMFGAERLARYATAAERAANADFLGRAFHVVVGNPPYVTPKDPAKRTDYRAFWPESATGKYGLAAPFAERLFTLGAPGAFVGQITGNAFMKRSFGVSLVEQVLPRWDLTDIVDTSGAYIPGHGTPTVVLIGRAQAPVSGTIRVVGGKRGEPSAPAVPAEGKVWRAIVEAGRAPSDASPFVTVSVYERREYGQHPWNVNGGGAPELQRLLEENNGAATVDSMGITSFTLQDDVYVAPDGHWRHHLISPSNLREMVTGDRVRDYSVDRCDLAVFPYDETLSPELEPTSSSYRFLWDYRARLASALMFGSKSKVASGLNWYEYGRLTTGKLRTPLTIVQAFVATHNHFVLDRGGKVFNRTAPVIKLPADATLADHLDLLGLLNSSTLGFWMKQVFFDKGNGGIGGGIAAEEWERFFEYDSTKLQRAPITDRDRGARVDLARALDDAAQQRAACLPAAVLAGGDWTPATLAETLAAARARYRALTHRMVALQEELDWLTYGSYGLLSDMPVRTPQTVVPLAPGHRPFEIVLARHNAACEPDERSAWFSRHGHAEVTDLPDTYDADTRALWAARLRAIAQVPAITLIEQPQFKRRWQTPDLDDEARKAARAWLLDRLEDLFAPAADDRPAGPLSEPVPWRLEQIANAWRDDARVPAVAAVYAGTADVDLTLLAEDLLRAEAVPDNIFRVYTDEGLRKLRTWQEVWALQDREDAGEKVKIPLPPQFAKGDFCDDRYFGVRGKLNVPRERFVLYADVFPARYGWNGWRDRARAMAQVEAFTLVETDATQPLPPPTMDDPRRCGATVGLWESLDDLRRWGDAAEADELRALAQEACGQKKCPCDVGTAWREWHAGKRTLSTTAEAARPDGATVEERAEIIRMVHRLRPPSGQQLALLDAGDGLPLADTRTAPVPLKALADLWTGPADRLEVVLDDLVASGDLAVKGRGNRRRFTLND